MKGFFVMILICLPCTGLAEASGTIFQLWGVPDYSSSKSTPGVPKLRELLGSWIIDSDEGRDLLVCEFLTTSISQPKIRERHLRDLKYEKQVAENAIRDSGYPKSVRDGLSRNVRKIDSKIKEAVKGYHYYGECRLLSDVSELKMLLKDAAIRGWLNGG